MKLGSLVALLLAAPVNAATVNLPEAPKGELTLRVMSHGPVELRFTGLLEAPAEAKGFVDLEAKVGRSLVSLEAPVEGASPTSP